MKKIWNMIAFGISAFLSPYITAAIFIMIIVYQNTKNLSQFLPWMGIAFFFAIMIPGGYILWKLEKKEIADIHLSDHTERKIPFMITAISATAGALVLFLIGAAKPVVVMMVAFAMNAITVALITLFWKVSIHTALYSSVITVLVILYGAKFAWLYLLLIPLAWSRIYRHRHSLQQVIGGAIIAFVSTSLVFWIFGYI